MKREELIRKVRRTMKKQKYHDLFQMFYQVENLVRGFIPIVKEGKEATDEYNDYPSDLNLVAMEIARDRVADEAQKLASKLMELYFGLSAQSKKLFTKTEFTAMIYDRITNLLYEEN